MAENAENKRLREAREGIKQWKKWGPYLSERQWGTVREDYSANGDAWNYFPHDQARSRAYHWGARRTGIPRRLPAGDSNSGMFGGNSNWRGPVWMPVNLLLYVALLRIFAYYGDGFTIECPTGSGQHLTLFEVAEELGKRLTRIFLQGPATDAGQAGRRPVLRVLSGTITQVCPGQ